MKKQTTGKKYQSGNRGGYGFTKPGEADTSSNWRSPRTLSVTPVSPVLFTGRRHTSSFNGRDFAEEINVKYWVKRDHNYIVVRMNKMMALQVNGDEYIPMLYEISYLCILQKIVNAAQDNVMECKWVLYRAGVQILPPSIVDTTRAVELNMIDEFLDSAATVADAERIYENAERTYDESFEDRNYSFAKCKS